MRDSIFNYFGNFAIEFWATIAGINNLPDPRYNPGDGIHLNDARHAVLFEGVVQKNSSTPIMDMCVAEGINKSLQATVCICPNPSDGNFTIIPGSISAKVVELSLFDLTLRAIFENQIKTTHFS